MKSWRYNTKQLAGSFIIEPTLEIQILARANRKLFPTVSPSNNDVQSCFTVSRHAFLVGFPITIGKVKILN